MAYDSKTYGQSPFGNAKQPNEQNPEAADSKLGTSGKPEAQGDRTSQRNHPKNPLKHPLLQAPLPNALPLTRRDAIKGPDSLVKRLVRRSVKRAIAP